MLKLKTGLIVGFLGVFLLGAAFAQTIKAPRARDQGTEESTVASHVFDPAQAFCDRQTFRLAHIAEVDIWVDYIGGLRTARTILPKGYCNSSTYGIIENILTNDDVDSAASLRTSLVRFYLSTSMSPDNSDRALDETGHFRYLNDVTLLSLLWLTCDSGFAPKGRCVGTEISNFPQEFLETSPVFCDFALPNNATIEFPNAQTVLVQELPGICTSLAHPTISDPNAAQLAWFELNVGLFGQD